MTNIKIKIAPNIAHKNIDVYANCFRDSGKQSEIVTKHYSVECKKHDVNILPKSNDEVINVCDDKLYVHCFLESYQSIRYSFDGTLNKDSAIAKKGIIELEPTDAENNLTEIAIGIYCDVQDVYKDICNVKVKQQIITPECFFNGSVTSTPLVISKSEKLTLSTRAENIIYSIDSARTFHKVENNSYDIAFSKLGNFNIIAYGLNGSKKSKKNEQQVTVIGTPILLDIGSGNALDTGKGFALFHFE